MDAQHVGIAGELATAQAVLARFIESGASAVLERISLAIAERLRAGGTVLACGNGGSAADAMHFCEELTGRYRADRPAIPAIACVDPGHLTCTANDYGYESVFSRWVEALGRRGDVLIALSTSGNSRNVLRAVDRARERGLLTVALLGKGGGVLRGLCDHEIIVPGETADRIQELHMLALHTIVGGLERALFA
jgi:D-sedoheptulose 7-phosphate isomerase